MPGAADRSSRPLTVVVLMGLPGSGKTTLAGPLAAALHARLISRDAVRAAMFVPCSFTDTEKHAAFRAVIEAVGVNCDLGEPTVVEGMPFSRAFEVEAVRARATAAGAVTIVVLCDVPVEVAQARVRVQREAGVPMAADRDPALVAEVSSRFADPPKDAFVVDMTGPVDQAVDAVLERIRSQVGAAMQET